jgi:hypothetical protein
LKNLCAGTEAIAPAHSKSRTNCVRDRGKYGVQNDASSSGNESGPIQNLNWKSPRAGRSFLLGYLPRRKR